MERNFEIKLVQTHKVINAIGLYRSQHDLPSVSSLQLTHSGQRIVVKFDEPEPMSLTRSASRIIVNESNWSDILSTLLRSMPMPRRFDPDIHEVYDFDLGELNVDEIEGDLDNTINFDDLDILGVPKYKLAWRLQGHGEELTITAGIHAVESYEQSAYNTRQDIRQPVVDMAITCMPRQALELAIDSADLFEISGFDFDEDNKTLTLTHSHISGGKQFMPLDTTMIKTHVFAEMFHQAMGLPENLYITTPHEVDFDAQLLIKW